MVKMKDSGIEWIGEIPENAKIITLKYFSYMKGRIGWQGLKATDFIEEGPFCVTGTDFKNGKVNWNTCYHVSEERYSMDSNIHIKKGDLLMTKDGTIGKLAIIDELPNKACLNSHLLIIRPLANKFTNKFLFYVMQSPIFSGYYSLVSSGTTMDSLSQEKTGNFKFPVFSIATQNSIVNLLDAKCDKIDELKADIQKQIETLEQYKKSVITEAVTKGINPNAKMKDSGIEWIGEIPEDWEVKPLGHILMERVEKNYPVKTDVILSLSIDIGITLYSEKTTNLDRFKDDITGYKLAHKGDLVLNSMNVISGAEGISAYYGCVSPVYYVLYDNDNENHFVSRFYDYHFKTMTLRKYLFSIGKGILAIDRGDGRVNTCRLKVSNYDLKHLHFPVPPKSEIDSIVNYLDKKCSKIDAAVVTKKQQLEKLEEYKKSLIFEYVTGKKEVTEEI